MATYDVNMLIEVGDINGDVALMRFGAGHQSDASTLANWNTNVGALVTALGAPGVITNGKVIRTGLSVLFSRAQLAGGVAAIDAEFPSVADKARLGFANSGGAKAIVSIPAPIEAIFHAPPSDDSVDPASAVAAFITACEGQLADLSGVLLNLYTGGVRQKSRARRRKQHRL